MKEIITNCTNCYYSDDQGVCGLGKHKAPGYSDRVLKTDDETWLVSKACPFHRHEKEVERIPELANPQTVLNKISLKYVLVASITESSNDSLQINHVMANLALILAGILPPKKIYLIDNRVNYDPICGPSYVLEQLKSLGCEYRYKKAHAKIKPQRLIAEFVDTNYLTFPFMIYVNDLSTKSIVEDSWWPLFLSGLNCLICHRMQTVLLGGDESKTFFLATSMFKIALSNFQEVIDCSEEFSYDVISKKAVFNTEEILQIGYKCQECEGVHEYHHS